MNRFALTLLVILAADAVRSQGPPTQTKKGTRPGRPNDNTDRGLPSGADVPDGTRYAPAPIQTRAGPPPAGRPAAGPPPPAVTAGRPAPPAGAPVLYGPPPPARRPAPPAALAGRPNDNTDRGLPSGADVPDGARTHSAAYFNYVAPAAPAVPAVPAMSCEAYCDITASYKPVCSINGNQYDNDCLRECTGEPRQCENPCPCNASPSEPSSFVYADAPITSDCSFCSQEWDPVCIDNEETVQNECIAKCEGKTITCSSSCPC